MFWLILEHIVKYLLIRHGETDANRATRVLYGKKGAPLNASGVEQAIKLRELLQQRGIDSHHEPVAVSELIRTQQTAHYAGFRTLKTYPLLNEVRTDDPQKTGALIARAIVPEQALAAAQAVLADPPLEKVWVTHGLLITALFRLLDLPSPAGFIPGFCEIREISF